MMRTGLQLMVAGLTCVLAFSAAQSQTNPSPVNPTGVPAQIIPTFGEMGITWGGMSGGGAPSVEGGTLPSNNSATNPGNYQSGGSDALSAMNATSYGALATTTAQQLGVNVEADAAIGQAESEFRNIPTANGSSSATGPWQFTTPTFLSVSQQHSLGYTAADVTDPQAQAVASAYLMHDYATAVSQAINQPATTLQTYGAWVFGPQAGSKIAAADGNTPLSSIVSGQSLSNNGMASWTVSQFRQVMTNRLGSAANQAVLTAS